MNPLARRREPRPAIDLARDRVDQIGTVDTGKIHARLETVRHQAKAQELIGRTKVLQFVGFDGDHLAGNDGTDFVALIDRIEARNPPRARAPLGAKNKACVSRDDDRNAAHLAGNFYDGAKLRDGAFACKRDQDWTKLVGRLDVT